jgi:hypothetical protein
MAIYRAGTLLIPSGPRHDRDRKHLHVVCNDTDEDGNNLVVPITSCRDHRDDPTCILEEWEHEWLWRKSYALYREAKILSATTLENGLKIHKIQRKADINGQAFLKVRNGVCISPRTPRKIKRYFGCP